MKVHNWDEIQEVKEFERPKPGGYVAVICAVEDNEEREYLSIEWDFSDGPYKGANADTFNRAGFWPTRLFRSYKESALGFFKAFKTCLEVSNPGYRFREDRLWELEGKRLGVVLGEEEYLKSTGAVGTRLYVAQTRSVKAIGEGDYRVPDRKTLSTSGGGGTAPTPGGYGRFAPLPEEDDGDIPF